jgi:hypothetical protein
MGSLGSWPARFDFSDSGHSGYLLSYGEDEFRMEKRRGGEKSKDIGAAVLVSGGSFICFHFFICSHPPRRKELGLGS